MNSVETIDPMSFKTRQEYAKRGKLIELLKLMPQSRWTEQDERDYNFLFHIFYMVNFDDNTDALILLGLSNLFDFKKISPFCSLSPFSYCLRYQYIPYASVLCALGYTHFNEETPINSATSYISIEFLISNGWRIDDKQDDKLVYHKSLFNFQQGVVKCRDATVVLLGLKKRRVILPKLDRFLVQQELAVAIWATRARIDENE